MRVDTINQITPELLEQAITQVIQERYTFVAPLGASGKNVLLFSPTNNSRQSGISIRLHSTGVEMLIANRNGAFLFYGKLHPSLGALAIAAYFHSTIDYIGEYAILSQDVAPIKLKVSWIRKAINKLLALK